MQSRSVIRFSAFAAASSLAFACGVQAKERTIDVSCNASSDYQVSLSGDAFVFENDQGRDTRVVLGGGKLFLNGKPALLSAADQKRVDAFETELRLLVPESRQVAVEAVGMAIDALSEVSIALSGDEGKRGDYDKVRVKALAAARNSKTLPIFNDQAMDGIVDPIVAEFVPDITGSALGFAMKSAFSSSATSRIASAGSPWRAKVCTATPAASTSFDASASSASTSSFGFTVCSMSLGASSRSSRSRDCGTGSNALTT